METINIRDKLRQIEMPVEELSMGDFDYIGEYTAKKSRNRNDPLFKSAGCFFRPNYERGMLIYSLIRRFEIRSMLEIGFGRGYASFCAAKAMCDAGFDDGSIVTVDPDVNQDHLKQLAQVFPQEWFSKLNLFQGTSMDAFRKLPPDQKFELVYIDGDHRAEAVRADWEGTKDRYTKFLLFDDYRFEDDKKDIEVRSVVDTIEGRKELVIMDRRIFHDDRGVLNPPYGQVLLTHPDFDQSSFLCEW